MHSARRTEVRVHAVSELSPRKRADAQCGSCADSPLHCALSECTSAQHSARSLDSTPLGTAVAALSHTQLITDAAETHRRVSAHPDHQRAGLDVARIEQCMTHNRGQGEWEVTFVQSCNQELRPLVSNFCQLL